MDRVVLIGGKVWHIAGVVDLVDVVVVGLVVVVAVESAELGSVFGGDVF